MEKKSDEIDLFKLFLRGVNIFRDNFWLIVSFFVIGTSLGVANYFVSRKVFENRMIISSGILTKSYGKLLAAKINKHLGESHDAALAKDLNIPLEVVEDIAHVKIEDVSELDQAKESDRFIITVETFDQKDLPEIQKGFVHYFENNEYVRIRVEQNKNFLKQVVDKIDSEIKDMENLKSRISNGEFFQNAKGNVSFDPTVVNTKILDLTKEKINLQNQFILANSVQVIEGFTPFETPSKPKLSVSLVAGAGIGLVFVAFVIAFKSIRTIFRMADAAKQNP